MIRELSAARGKEKWDKRNWIATDLDGTLALQTKWRGDLRIGPPIPKMLARVRAWLAQGKQVKIFTARVDDLIQWQWMYMDQKDLRTKKGLAEGERLRKAFLHDWAVREVIQKYCKKWIGQVLEITNRKDRWTTEIWDDRARQVAPNKGTLQAADYLGRSFNKRSRSG